MSIVYGHESNQSADSDDDYIRLARVATNELVHATSPGVYLVELIPALRYAPSWVPFKRKAAEWRRHADAMVDTPLADVKQQRVSS